MPRYQSLGYVRKKKGLQLYTYSFNYSLLQDDLTEVFVIKKPKKRVLTLVMGTEKERDDENLLPGGSVYDGCVGHS